MPRKPEKFQEMREKSRTQILNTALILFSKKGYHGTSISDIAKAAGISKGLAYNYFDSKQSLVEEVISLLLVKMGELFQVLNQVTDPREKLRLLIAMMFDEALKNEEFWRLYFGLILQPELTETTTKLTSGVMHESIGLIENLLWEIGFENHKIEAKLLAGILDGVLFHKMFLRDAYPLDEVKDYLFKKYCQK